MKNNPYVGPRPYTQEDRDKFYGRNREARDLLDKIVAERVVLFYAQSGAGKSSLLNARILPELEERGFDVWPSSRVGNDLPPGIGPDAVENIFVFSTLLGWADPETPSETLTGHTLLSFLQQFYAEEESELDGSPEDESPDNGLPILIWDQFEEIFTTHRDRWQEASGFFEQVREALDEMPELGVIFVMREDHVAAVEPYACQMPRRLRARFRMERLGYEGALEAISKPAARAGCPFDQGVAERLVDDLRRIRTSGTATMDETPVGPYVEPVQLQVVCSRLWDNLPDQVDKLIQWEEIEQFGDIDQALTDFYTQSLEGCASETGIGERQLRRWFGQQIITPMQTRGLVMRGEQETGNLPNAAVDVLDGQHIVRAEARAGARWYELCHDRMVEPVLQSNAAWEAARQTPLRLAALRWQETGDASLLYRDAALKEALTWTKTHRDDAEPYEVEFLDASQQAEDERIRRRRLAVVGSVVGLLIIVVMTALTILAIKGRRDAQVAQATAEAHRVIAENAGHTAEARRVIAENAEATAEARRVEAVEAKEAEEEHRRIAEEHARIALSRQLAAQSINELQSQHPDLALLMAIEAANIKGTREAIVALREVLAIPKPTRLYLAAHLTGVDAVSWDQAEKRILTAGRDGTARIWDAQTGEELARLEHGARVRIARWSTDGKRILTGCEDGTTRIWDAQTGKVLHSLKEEGLVYRALWNADENRVLTVQAKTHIWDVATGAVLLTLPGRSDRTYDAVWNRDESYILTDGNARAQIWDAQTGEELVLMEHDGWGAHARWSTNERHVLTSDSDYKARMWDAETGEELLVFEGHESTVRRAVWNRDESRILTVSDDSTARVWDAQTGKVLLILEGHMGWVWYGAWDATEDYILTSSWDGTARVWDAATGELRATLVGHIADILPATWNRTSDQILTGSLDGTARVWDLALVAQAGGELPALSGHTAVCMQAHWSSDESRILTGSDDNTARIWDSQTGAQLLSLEADAQDVKAVAWSSDDSRVLGGYYRSEGDYAYVWDAQTGQQILALVGHTNGVNNVAWNTDDSLMLTTSWDGSARLWDAQTGAEIHRFEHTKGVWYAVWDGDERRIVTCGDDNIAKLWDAQTGENLVALVGHEHIVVRAAWSTDGSRVVTASGDGTARVWDAETGAELMSLTEHSGWVYDVTWNRDDSLILTGDGEAAYVWDAETGERLYMLDGHTDAVTRVRWSADESRILTASRDGTARIWNAANGTELATLAGHTGAIQEARWNADESRVLTAGSDGVARQFYTNLDALIEAACQQSLRNMTLEEWESIIKDQDYRATCPNLPSAE